MARTELTNLRTWKPAQKEALEFAEVELKEAIKHIDAARRRLKREHLSVRILAGLAQEEAERCLESIEKDLKNGPNR